MLNRAAEFFSGGQDLPQLLQGEFNQGFLLGVSLAVAMILLMLVLKIIFWMIFRTRRCREIALDAGDGTVSISHKAIDTAVRSEVSGLPGMSVESIRVLRKGKRCKMQIRCGFSTAAGSSFPELTRIIRERVQKMLQETFGIDCISKIDIQLETLETAAHARAEESPAKETDSSTIPMM